MRVLIVGCGYVGSALGAELVLQGHQVHGLRRRPTPASHLQETGILPIQCDLTDPRQVTSLPGPFDWVINTASSGRAGIEAYRQVYLEGTRHLIQWLKTSPPARYVYTSSTGVYGQDDGSTVVESDPTEPESETGRILVETEQALLNAARDIHAILLRVAGIYGPGRGHFYRQYLKGEATLTLPATRWLNMVHRDDVVGAIIAALEKGEPGEIYNVVDNEPIPQIEFAHWLADTLNRPLPPAAPAEEPPTRRTVTNKQVSNAKLRQHLGYEFKYPTFREGYGSLITSGL